MSGHRKGFTLVELSIVLIIIGLIIGGVLKGTDMINSAKQKKFYNTFVKGWQITADQYRDRTGQILGDGTANGGTAAAVNGVREARNLSTTTAIQTRLADIGLDVPVTNTGNSGSYTVEGKYVTSTVEAILTNETIGGTARNVFQLDNVPTDVAVAIDTMVDGTADASLGDARRTNGGASLWEDAEATTMVDMTIIF
jgi:prepilin-type N-terminal cleavage/methylation domain-containing protein